VSKRNGVIRKKSIETVEILLEKSKKGPAMTGFRIYDTMKIDLTIPMGQTAKR
jgi:hypothetical protein